MPRQKPTLSVRTSIQSPASAVNAKSSLPGLTPQVGFTRLAAYNTAQLGQARVAVQSIHLRKAFLAKKMDARVKPAHDRLERFLDLAPMRLRRHSAATAR